MKKVTTHEAKTQLSRLLSRVERGEVVLIQRRDKAVAKLVRAIDDGGATPRPKVGQVTSAPVKASPDAFTGLEDADLREWGLD